jgi:hypothetical protein
LQEKGIKAILNVTPHKPNMYPEDFKYLKFEINDDHLVKVTKISSIPKVVD